MKYPKFEIIKIQNKQDVLQIKENSLISIITDLSGHYETDGKALLDIIKLNDVRLSEKGFWLNNHYDWVIVQDKDNRPCLVPLKKEK